MAKKFSKSKVHYNADERKELARQARRASSVSIEEAIANTFPPIGDIAAHIRKELRKLREYTGQQSIDKFDMVVLRHEVAGPLSQLARALGYKTISID